MNEFLHDLKYNKKSIENKYNIVDNCNKSVIMYYLSNTHIGEPTYNIAYIKENNGYNVIFSTENVGEFLEYIDKNNFKIMRK